MLSLKTAFEDDVDMAGMTALAPVDQAIGVITIILAL
jgi:hypothetical protein